MKRRLIINASISLSALIISAAVFSCRTRPPRATAKDVDGLIADARALSPILESKCSSCHNQGGQNGQMPGAWYNAMARATQPIEQCLETNRCYESPIPTGNEATCWQCVTENGLASMNGGIFHAAIRGGIVKTLADANHIPQATLDSYLPMPMGANDGANDIAPADLGRISQWLKNEALNNFAGIEDIRPAPPAPNDNPEAMTCDTFHPSIAPTIIEDFHRDRMAMLGCPGNGWPADPSTCLQDFPNLPVTNDAIPGLVVKELRKFAPGATSSYWTRTSPDGRFSSTGNGKIHDLKTTGRVITVQNDSIDPIYSPDGRYYSWPDIICPMDPLYDLATTDVGTSTASSGCKRQNFGAYRSLGADPSGDTLLIKSYDSNNIGRAWPGTPNQDRRSFHSSSRIDILRISNNQIGQNLSSTSITGEGSYQIGPSGQLIVGHITNDRLGDGYRVRNIRPSGGAVDLSHPELSGYICMHGEKPNLSFDNRFVVFHHYTDGSPQDTGAVAETANIFIYDLKTKKGFRVTNMPARGRAFFPHFRADGWLYFLIKQSDENNRSTESIVATNAAILLKAQR